MTSVAEIVDATLMLHAWACSDTTALLAYAGVWVDPFHTFCSDEEWGGDVEYEITPDLDIAWAVSRQHWMDIYADMNVMLFEDVPLSLINRRVTADIYKRLPSGSEGYMLELTELAYGYVPLPYYGNPLWTEDGMDAGHSAYPVMDAIALVEGEGYPATIGMDEMIDILKAQTPPNTGLHFLWAWVNGSTGNSSVDYTFEEAAENGISSIDLEQLEMACEIASDADEIMRGVFGAVDEFKTDDELCRQVCENAILAYCAGIQEVFHVHTIDCPTLEWGGDARKGADGGTVVDLEVHALRDRAVA